MLFTRERVQDQIPTIIDLSHSVLSVVSRLFEKLVHEQLYPYIKDSLSKTQSGFKPGHSSTESGLLNTTNKWIINIDKEHFNLILFLDL